MESDVNTNQITSGVARRIHEEYGDEFTIYANSVPQDFRTPSFYIRQISGGFIQQLGRRHTLEVVIMVTYYPPEHSKEEQKDILTVLSRMYPALEYIDVASGLIRADGMEHEITEHELHMKLSYRLSVFRTYDRGAKMQVLKQVQHIKETSNGSED